MSKVIILGDLHIGHSKDDTWRSDYIGSYIKEVIEYAKNNGIKNIIQTGDVFDSRSGLTHSTLKTNNDCLIEPIQKNEIYCDVIVGNHDLRNENTLTPNAIREVFGNQNFFSAHDEPRTIDIDGLKIDMIPWICDENKEEIFDFIKESTSSVCVGHFELSGFMYNATTQSTGDDPNFLSGYDKVISGHYHTINEGANVLYVGTPYTLNFNDVNEQRGFWILDTENVFDLEFVPNKDMWHKQIDYVDDIEIDIEEYRNKSVRIRIETKINRDKFEFFVDRIADVAHATKIEDFYTIRNNEDLKNILDSEIQVTGGIIDIGKDRIFKNENNDEDGKTRQLKILEDLYNEAEILLGEEQ